MLKNPATIALVGNPNSGKTTLFNALTGSSERAGNWAGVTVAPCSQTLCIEAQSVRLVDLPGTYTLTMAQSRSTDENFASQYLRSTSVTWVLNVVDGGHLERNLYVTLQCLEQGLPVIVALNRAHKIDVQALSEGLGCSVIPVVAKKRIGLEALKRAISISSKTTPAKCLHYPEAVERGIEQIAQYLLQSGEQYTRYQALCYLEGEQAPTSCAEKIEAIRVAIEMETGHSPDVWIARTRYDWIEALLRCMSLGDPVTGSVMPVRSATTYIDRVVCDRYFAIPIFLGVMYALFFFAIRVGGMFQDYLEWAAHGIFVEQMSDILHVWHAPGWLIALLVSGMGEGITTVLTFVPVIGAMFLALVFLEECGYMARAAFVIDRFMRMMGLPGKSFVPMMMGFGCNVPAIMGMRTLDNRRDRVLAVMMSPFLSCGARLAIFTVFASAFFPDNGPNTIFWLYTIGIAMALLTGMLLKRTLLKGEAAPLLLEMPEYQWPSMRSLCKQAGDRLKRFLLNASQLIVPVCILLGGLNHITWKGEWLGSVDAAKPSILATVGKTLVPVFEPMGVEEDNWPAVVGLLTGVLAKEVVVGTLNSLYSDGEMSEGSAHGEMVHRFGGQISAFAYLLFVLLYFPCISATAAMWREVQRKWTLFSIGWTTGLAYVVAVGYYQMATFFEHPLQSAIWIATLCTISAVAIWKIRRYSEAIQGKTLPTPIVLQQV